MKTVLLVGKMNEMVKDINEFLHSYFRVQLNNDNTNNIAGMIRVVKPDIIVISLIGFFDVSEVLFATIKKDFPDIPVITIGTEGERKSLGQFYGDGQFENLTRPIENSVLLTAICGRLGLSEKELEAQKIVPDDGRKKVLVVDDNVTTLRSIKGMLEKRYQVTLANSGMKAMTSIGKNRPDMILLDYEMPVCDGKQTLEMIRADEDLADMPVVFLTGVNDKEHIHAVLALRPAGYLLKPAVPEKLIEIIEKVTGGEE